jgi:hypothetical protein
MVNITVICEKAKYEKGEGVEIRRIYTVLMVNTSSKFSK